MAGKTSTAEISKISSQTGDQPGLVHERLLFVGEDSLQMNILKSLVSKEFSLPAVCVSLDQLADTASAESIVRDDTLVILDCQSLTLVEMTTILEKLDQNRMPGVVLINLEKQSACESLAVWPHVTGMLKSSLSPELAIKGFDQVLRGGLWLPRNVMEDLVIGNGRSLPPKSDVSTSEARLTRRETQILMKLAEGSSNTQIADALFLSEHTVKTHLYNIYRKVNVKNRTQASNWLKQNSVC